MDDIWYIPVVDLMPIQLVECILGNLYTSDWLQT